MNTFRAHPSSNILKKTDPPFVSVSRTLVLLGLLLLAANMSFCLEAQENLSVFHFVFTVWMAVAER